MKVVIVSIIVFAIACTLKQRTQNIKEHIATFKDSNYLDPNIQTLELEYIDWSCACANWAVENDIDKYKDTGKLSEHCVFSEPAYSNITLPDTLGYSGDIIKFTGQFYMRKGYPKGYIQNEEHADSAKIFRYNNYSVIRSMYREFVPYKSNQNKFIIVNYKECFNRI